MRPVEPQKNEDSKEVSMVWTPNAAPEASSAMASAFTATAVSYTHLLNTNVSGTGSLVKNGSGTLTIQKMLSYTGGTTVNKGVLVAVSYTHLGPQVHASARSLIRKSP